MTTANNSKKIARCFCAFRKQRFMVCFNVDEEDFGIKWIPYVHKRYSRSVYNQPTRFQCQSTSACQLLKENHGRNYDIDLFYDGLSERKLRNVCMMLNSILGKDYYRLLRTKQSPDVFDVEGLLNKLLKSGKVWMVSVKEKPDSDNGHTLVVRKLTYDGLLEVYDPWGKRPGTKMGTIAKITKATFKELWRNSKYATLFGS